MSERSKDDAEREERLAILRGEDLLVRLAVAGELLRPDSPAYTDERYIAWVDEESRTPERAHEAWDRAQIEACAARIQARVEATRLGVRVIAGSPELEHPPVQGTVPPVIDDASARGAAPRLDLTAAAGIGRDLWDEPCEQWVRLPRVVAAGRYVALNVNGESMTPLLHTGDTVLVQLGPAVARNSLVLARVPDGGYVIKRVGRVTRMTLELISLNPAFPPFTIVRDERSVVGTVVLRWCPHERPAAERRQGRRGQRPARSEGA